MPPVVRHSLRISWDTDAQGNRHNPQLHGTEVFIAGLQFRYSCYNGNTGDWPYQMHLELTDNGVNDLDHHWAITLKRHNVTRNFSQNAQKHHFYSFNEHCFARSEEFELVEYDAHPYRLNFEEEQQAKKCGNDYRIELSETGDDVVWVNRDLLAADSSYFGELLSLPSNKESLRVKEVSKEDFLDYVYCVHPPTLKLSLARVHRISTLAAHFGNKALEARCVRFVKEFQSEDPMQLCRHLVEADRHGLPEVFSRVLNLMTRADLKLLNASLVQQFQAKNLHLVVQRLITPSWSSPRMWISATVTALYGFVTSFMSTEVKKQQAIQIDVDFLLDKEMAASRNYDCIILIEGHESKPIYVKKSLLAMQSEYFKTLFFGDFVEAKTDEVTLKDVDFDDFLEYLAHIHSPSPPLSMKRVGSVLAMADQFRNEILIKHCCNFFLQNLDDTGDKLETLYLADQFNMEKLFTVTLEQLKEKLEGVDVEKVVHFRAKNLHAFVDYCIKHLL